MDLGDLLAKDPEDYSHGSLTENAASAPWEQSHSFEETGAQTGSLI